MKKVLMTLCLSIVMMITGCNLDLDVEPNIDEQNYETAVFEVYTGILDGVETDFRKQFYHCNPIDSFMYNTDTGEAILNSDSTQVECSPVSITRTEFSINPRPLYDE